MFGLFKKRLIPVGVRDNSGAYISPPVRLGRLANGEKYIVIGEGVSDQDAEFIQSWWGTPKSKMPQFPPKSLRPIEPDWQD